jgi:hypothetical protein
MDARFITLATLLRERLAVIADHALRDADPAEHLQRLQQVSESLTTEHQRLRAALPARLEHFMSQASYQKALAFLEHGDTGHG